MSANRKREGAFASEPAGKKSEALSELNNVGEDDGDLVFEDPYGDQYEDEEEVQDENSEGEEDGMEAEEQEQEAEGGEKEKKEVWRPGVDRVAEGEELDYDPSAYVMYHSFRTEWPCLTFDFIRDNLGDNRQRFPHTMYMVAGSQADRPENNMITLLQLTELHKTYVAADSEDESDNDEDLDEDPTIEHSNVPHVGGVNRLRAMPQTPGIVASMSDTGKAHIFDLTGTVKSLMAHGPRQAPPNKPAFTFAGHKTEGYALDWSSVQAGQLATGDCTGLIHIWRPTGSTWKVDSNAPFAGHTGSVEDLQWSPSEATVFASASADRTVRIWDTRDRSKSQISVSAHKSDVNVISWNRSVGYLLASGADDGSFKVWDLRTLGRGGEPLAHFTYHQGPITSIEWATHDESVLAVSSADNQLTLWDLSVEAEEGAQADPAFPPQLLFLHLGQRNIKELHHHPQIPGMLVSTAEDSFNVFKPAISVSS
eukprot:gene7953-8773_t